MQNKHSRHLRHTSYNEPARHGDTCRGQEPVHDPAVNEAFDGLGWTYACFQQVYGRNSIDNVGLPLQASVHYGINYDNALWDGTRMIFGDGDQVYFNRWREVLALTVAAMLAIALRGENSNSTKQ